MTMDSATFSLLILSVTLAVAAFHAWRQGNEKRDVALLGAGAAAAALL